MRFKIKANKGPCEKIRQKMEIYRALERVRIKQDIKNNPQK